MSEPATGKNSSAATLRRAGARRDRVLGLLRASGPSTSIDIAEALGVSREAALTALRALERDGLIAEAFRVASRVGSGRKTIVWKLAR